MIKKIFKCRVCGNSNLVLVVDLGDQYLTGVFPKHPDVNLTCGPLRLVKCHGDSDEVCGLLQLEHSYDTGEMYGENYGYRSGLNQSMISHLHNKVHEIRSVVQLNDGDLVVDIGSNDGTTLAAYPNTLDLVGFDPAGRKFQKFYPSHVKLVADFFSKSLLDELYPTKKAKVITSFSMFYDLEDPIAFAKDVASALDDDGVWVFEQSYMPSMLQSNSYDTICHEHLEYYGANQIAWIAKRAGLRLIDISLNETNGGSFSVIAVRQESFRNDFAGNVARLLASEREAGLFELQPYLNFSKAVEISRAELRKFLDSLKASGKSIYGLGASTKGNVILQYCDIDQGCIDMIGEVNEDKFGSLTPGTWIPIEPQQKVFDLNPDYFLVLPWHFRDFFLTNKKFSGKKLIFPLPKLQIELVS